MLQNWVLKDPFLARIAYSVIENYSEAYPELIKNQKTILDNITREEERFAKTLESGLNFLDEIFTDLKSQNSNQISGQVAFDLYATHGLPFEITRDIASEIGFLVDEVGFHNAMEQHRLDSGAGKAFGTMDADDVDIYRSLFEELQIKKQISNSGVRYDPYSSTEVNGTILALIKDGLSVQNVCRGDQVEVLLPETCFYIESGGQVSDTGTISIANKRDHSIEVTNVRKPAAGIIVHVGIVKKGEFAVGDSIIASVNRERRKDIMRNHTATHLLHAILAQNFRKSRQASWILGRTGSIAV